MFVRLGKWEDGREKTKDSCRADHARRALSCAVAALHGFEGIDHGRTDGECVVFARGAATGEEGLMTSCVVVVSRQEAGRRTQENRVDPMLSARPKGEGLAKR